MALADPLDDFAAGYELGYESGHDVGYATAEADMAEAWMAEVHRIRALAKPDDYMTRVRAAEKHVRRLADRQWLNPDAWESAAHHGMTEGARRRSITSLFPDGDTLARAIGVQLPKGHR